MFPTLATSLTSTPMGRSARRGEFIPLSTVAMRRGRTCGPTPATAPSLSANPSTEFPPEPRCGKPRQGRARKRHRQRARAHHWAQPHTRARWPRGQRWARLPRPPRHLSLRMPPRPGVCSSNNIRHCVLARVLTLPRQKNELGSGWRRHRRRPRAPAPPPGRNRKEPICSPPPPLWSRPPRRPLDYILT